MHVSSLAKGWLPGYRRVWRRLFLSLSWRAKSRPQLSSRQRYASTDWWTPAASSESCSCLGQVTPGQSLIAPKQSAYFEGLTVVVNSVCFKYLTKPGHRLSAKVIKANLHLWFQFYFKQKHTSDSGVFRSLIVLFFKVLLKSNIHHNHLKKSWTQSETPTVCGKLKVILNIGKSLITDSAVFPSPWSYF